MATRQRYEFKTMRIYLPDGTLYEADARVNVHSITVDRERQVVKV